MKWWAILLIVIGVILVALIVFLMIFGRKLTKKQADAQKQMEMTKQQVTMLIIDKQKKKMTEAGLPEAVMKETPKYMRRMKVPVVKAKIGPRIMVLLSDAAVYEILPVKKTVTVMVSGIYITELRQVRGGSVPKLPVKKNAIARFRDKLAGKVKKS